MNIRHCCLLFFSLLVFINCEEPEVIEEVTDFEQVQEPSEEIEEEQETEEPEEAIEPELITYLTFNSGEMYSSEDNDNYIILHDQNGKLLDYKAFENNETFVFEKLDSALVDVSSITVTLARMNSNQEYGTFNVINSFTGIEKGLILHTNTNEKDSSEETNSLEIKSGDKLYQRVSKNNSERGNYSIYVHNVDGVSQMAVSNNHGDYGVFDLDIDTDTYVLANRNFKRDEEYFIYIEDFSGNYRYTYFKTPQLDSDIILDFNDFSKFDQFVDINLPEHQELRYLVKFREDLNSPNGYMTTGRVTSYGEKSTARFGFIEGMPDYRAILSLKVDDTWGYGITGNFNSIPQEQDLPFISKPNFEMVNNDLHHLEYTTDISYIAYTSYWKHEVDELNQPYYITAWTIEGSNKEKPIIGHLPEEILAKHPNLELEKLNYSQTTLTTQGATYSERVKHLFDMEEYETKPMYQHITMYADK
ncbi:hypothetical protein ACFSSG_03165 [Euzebyella marina]|uniref:hypothetical protein n=1 Tax=Euzebyella marina TaxID=1761453 RepID=UPI0013CEE58E|nr:hypothetical protein [Euzebyella marina]